MSRDLKIIEVAENLCSKPSKCLTTLFVDDPTEIKLKMEEEKYSKYQVNIMIIPSKNLQNTVLIPVYCPAFAIKYKIVNAWNPVKKSLIFQQTEPQCGDPLAGNFF